MGARSKRTAKRRGTTGPASQETMIRDMIRVLAILDKPHSVAELAKQTGLHPQKLYRLLRILPKLGIDLGVEAIPRAVGAGNLTRRYHLTTENPLLRLFDLTKDARILGLLLGRLEERAKAAGVQGLESPPAARGDEPLTHNLRARTRRLSENLMRHYEEAGHRGLIGDEVDSVFMEFVGFTKMLDKSRHEEDLLDLIRQELREIKWRRARGEVLQLLVDKLSAEAGKEAFVPLMEHLRQARENLDKEERDET